MTTATAKRTKKRKPRVKAKPCKKATLRDQRVKRARAKTALAVVLLMYLL